MQHAPLVRNRLATSMAAFGLAACHGALHETVGQSDVDASPLATLPPPACDPGASVVASGECRGGQPPGVDCLMCHHQGGSAPPYAFAGTLYDEAGVQPIAGAVIYVQDSSGNTATAITGMNGNFFTPDGFVTYPAKVFVSRCPDVREMLNPVDEITGANCNTSECHTAGFRVHLP